MDFELTDDQQQFRSVLRDFVDKEVIPVAREYEQAGRYPTEIVEGLKEMGLFGITVPEEYGGLDLDPVAFAIVFEELARGWMGVAGVLGSHSLSCRLIAMHGTEEQKSKYLPDLATGKRRTGLGLTEPDAGTDVQGIRTVARETDGGYVVDGTKTWITNARFADPLPVMVKTDPTATPAHKGMSVLLVEQGTPGYSVLKDIPKVGYKGPESCEVLLDGAQVPAENLLGGVEGRGMQQVLSALEWGRVNIAARSVGVAQRAYDEALRYSQERKAFGQEIAQFQAIQLKLAQMATNVQAARLMAYWAASRLTLGRADGPTGMAKIFCSDVALEAAIDSMKVHGGYGYSSEYEIER
ncbi:MAG TPA: acyl-CoA dehydrogenase family protein, partial [Nocardioidaceae bacterium]|nr:acyl-CoA dehydrogenase family protein [Nocardioidaceae bacterium]